MITDLTAPTDQMNTNVSSLEKTFLHIKHVKCLSIRMYPAIQNLQVDDKIYWKMVNLSWKIVNFSWKCLGNVLAIDISVGSGNHIFTAQNMFVL